jgi:hypothetical protein
MFLTVVPRFCSGLAVDQAVSCYRPHMRSLKLSGGDRAPPSKNVCSPPDTPDEETPWPPCGPVGCGEDRARQQPVAAVQRLAGRRGIPRWYRRD